MIDIIVYIFSFLGYAFMGYYYMNMFQQNSYRPERFWNWLKKNPLPRVIKKAKVKFAFTARMRRLCLTLLLLWLISAFVSPWLSLSFAILSPFSLLLANYIISPVEKAISKSYYNDAKRILSSRPDLIIIGVTGSYGKTSIKNYLYRILSEKYNVLITPGNFNTTLGVVRTIREKLEPFHQVFIVEMGAKQVGDIKEICDLVHPTIGIVSAVGQMHLETFGSLENIQKTKFELINALPKEGYGVINAESAGIKSYKDIPSHCKIDSYGIDSHRCSARAANIKYSTSGMSFDFITKQDSQSYSTQLLGANNVLNLCAALLVAQYLGVNASSRRKAVSKIQAVEHRLSIMRKGSITVLDDAYNSNPEGATMALQVLGSIEVPNGANRILVTPGFVEMGSAQGENCKKLGALAARHSDILLIVNKLNREAILKGALGAGMDQQRIICADSLAEGLKMVAPYFTPGSVVLYENDLPDMFN